MSDKIEALFNVSADKRKIKKEEEISETGRVISS